MYSHRGFLVWPAQRTLLQRPCYMLSLWKSWTGCQSADLRIKTQVSFMSPLHQSSDNKMSNTSFQCSSYRWVCTPALVSPLEPSRGSLLWCAADPRGLCVDAPVCSGLSCCRAPVRSKLQSPCCRRPGTLRPGSLEWLELEREDSLISKIHFLYSCSKALHLISLQKQLLG